MDQWIKNFTNIFVQSLEYHFIFPLTSSDCGGMLGGDRLILKAFDPSERQRDKRPTMKEKVAYLITCLIILNMSP